MLTYYRMYQIEPRLYYIYLLAVLLELVYVGIIVRWQMDLGGVYNRGTF